MRNKGMIVSAAATVLPGVLVLAGIEFTSSNQKSYSQLLWEWSRERFIGLVFCFWTTTFQDRIILSMTDIFRHRGGPKTEALIWILTSLVSRGSLKFYGNPIKSLISKVHFKFWIFAGLEIRRNFSHLDLQYILCLWHHSWWHWQNRETLILSFKGISIYPVW